MKKYYELKITSIQRQLDHFDQMFLGNVIAFLCLWPACSAMWAELLLTRFPIL